MNIVQFEDVSLRSAQLINRQRNSRRCHRSVERAAAGHVVDVLVLVTRITRHGDRDSNTGIENKPRRRSQDNRSRTNLAQRTFRKYWAGQRRIGSAGGISRNRRSARRSRDRHARHGRCRRYHHRDKAQQRELPERQTTLGLISVNVDTPLVCIVIGHNWFS